MHNPLLSTRSLPLHCRAPFRSRPRFFGAKWHYIALSSSVCPYFCPKRQFCEFCQSSKKTEPGYGKRTRGPFKLNLCIDAFTGDLLDAVSSSKDLKTAEVAAIVLGQPGVVVKPQDEATARSTIINLLANMNNTKRPLKTALLFKLLDILDIVSSPDDQAAVRKLMLKVVIRTFT